MRRAVLILGGLVLALIPPALAQQGQLGAAAAAQEPQHPLEYGARIRVTAQQSALDEETATFVAMRGDTLEIRRARSEYARGRWIRDSVTTLVPVASVSKLEVSVGRRSNIDRGIRTGLLVGAGAGLLIGAAASGGEGGDFVCDGGECVLKGTLGGAIWGLLIGATIGAFSDRDVWSEVRLSDPRDVHVSVLPRPDGLAVGLSLRF